MTTTERKGPQAGGRATGPAGIAALLGGGKGPNPWRDARACGPAGLAEEEPRAETPEGGESRRPWAAYLLFSLAEYAAAAALLAFACLAFPARAAPAEALAAALAYAAAEAAANSAACLLGRDGGRAARGLPRAAVPALASAAASAAAFAALACLAPVGLPGDARTLLRLAAAAGLGFGIMGSAGLRLAFARSR